MLRATFLYHVLDDPAFATKAALASASIPVVPIGGGAKVPRAMYSLKRDMDELRKIGAGKGIVDAGVKTVGTSANGRDLVALKVGKGESKPFTPCRALSRPAGIRVTPKFIAEHPPRARKKPPPSRS